MSRLTTKYSLPKSSILLCLFCVFPPWIQCFYPKPLLVVSRLKQAKNRWGKTRWPSIYWRINWLAVHRMLLLLGRWGNLLDLMNQQPLQTKHSFQLILESLANSSEPQGLSLATICAWLLKFFALCPLVLRKCLHRYRPSIRTMSPSEYTDLLLWH